MGQDSSTMAEERVVIGKTEQKYVDEHVERYKFACKFANGRAVLDAACGSGYGTEMLSKYALSVLGVDNDMEAIQLSKSRLESIEAWDLDNIDSDRHFDLIVSFETIEHLENPKHFIDWAFNHCDMFVFSVPLNCPSPFHKHVYKSVEDVQKLIGKECRWLSQKRGEGDTEILEGTDGKFEYLIGVWKH